MRALRGRTGERVRHGAVTALAVLLLAACAATPAPPLPATQVATPAETVTVLDGADPAALATATSAALFTSAPLAVLAAADDPGAQADAAGRAAELGVPLLLTPDPSAELDRLGATGVVPVGPGAQQWAADAGREVLEDPQVVAPPARDVLALTVDAASPAAATARASGARVEAVGDPDPRVAPPAGLDPRPAHVVALGGGFGTAEQLSARLDVAATGTTLPGGGQVLFPGRRMVALYGHPGVPALGVLGEQGVAESVARAQALAAEYRPVSDVPVVPAFELISTVADSGPGPDGDFSSEATVEFLRPWVDAAREAGVYVVLDLQPGRADFLTQAQRYAELLAQPHVGLALDPEWRLEPGQRPSQQIGTVSVDEVNAVATWLADLTRDNALPQKLLMVHQFRLTMIRERERLDTSRDELAVVLHADGFGVPGEKLETWAALHQGEPAGVAWGWKNFYDEDTPMFTPAETLRVGPVPPVFVSFQ
ncbi:hypothetical protein I4I73_19475 [Pseudonocardia sp. KRD-184]|uniref:Lipoprotein n=1 Tax=Pseudonocardia oceani TaxID=2792013 RepID=A0ABS6UE37_9PSEU|nr:hypothetical protein [Pseudonocardia oceani]MBW0098167.1 hypothetical protein [Pseudonocardia oceani]MBW0110714.1 hypothetical protein [Pseudonocardia oceani]MBW0124780.1 hypothetical protein [Pseudonocardia oceani]MBW0130510.1 hypothetical protein [Pseudonocardia oceani]